MQKHTHASEKGFTLIELLVVIGIIALLAAILMPSLAQVREMAKAASCLSNLHNVGLALKTYETDSHRFPSAYEYLDGESSAGGYHHWTAMVNQSDYTDPVTAGKYPRSAAQYVCPSHAPGGWAPSNFTIGRIPTPPSGQASQDATGKIDDQQAPRLSYAVNEAIMPRKKYSAAHDLATPPGTSNLCLVSSDEVDAAQNTILAAEFSDSPNCIWGSSVGGGSAYKSHRPTNGIKSDQTNNVFNGEGYTLGTKVHKLTYAEATTAINNCLAAAPASDTTEHHISYTNPSMHKTGSNYLFTDGHAAKYTLQETLDPGNYMWGRKVYSCADKPVVQDN